MKKNMLSRIPELLIILAVILILSLAGCGGSSSSGTSIFSGGEGATRTGAVTGTVIDSTSNDEVQNAVVTIGGQSTLTDWVGHYEIQDVPAGKMSVQVTCDGYLTYTGAMRVVAETTTVENIYISPPSQVEGTAIDGRSNNPLEGVAVTLGDSSALTNELGHYTLTEVPAGLQRLTARKTGYNPASALARIPSDETYTQDFTLYPAGSTGSIQGTVTDAISGMPLGGVQITVGEAKATTDARGQFLLTGAPSGTQTLSAIFTGFNKYEGTVEVGDRTIVTFDFEMARPGTAGTVSGQILDMNTGETLKDATVTIGSKTTLSGSKGKFSFTYIPAGTPTITVSKADYLTHSDTVIVEPDTINDKDLTISKTPLRKGPYLLYNSDPSTMTVRWQTFNSPLEAKLEWGETTAYGHSATVTENSGAMNEHQFSHTITGLTEDKLIYYKVTVDGQSEKGSFKTAPAPSATDVSFYSYGDTRAGHALWEGVNDHDLVCQAIMNDMKADSKRQTILLHNGDIVRHGLDEAYWDTQYFMRCYKAQLEVESTLPILAAIGNHECYLTNCSGLDYADGGKLYRKYWPYAMYPRNDRFYYSFDYGPVHYASVDTWMHPDYTPGTDQYDWLSQDLANSSKPWKVVYMHTPGWDVDTLDNKIIDGLTPLFQQNGVKLVIAGHVHHYSRCLVDGITWLAMGGGGAPMDFLKKPPYPSYVKKAELKFHFGRFDVKGDAINATIKDLYGNEIDSFDITR